MSETAPYRKLPELTVQVTEPSYRAVLEWMQTTDLPNISYDCWARGNYTRRLLWQRFNGVAPLRVAVRSVEEIRRAHARLALLGVPIDFVYTGPLHASGRVLHLYPWNMNHDAGWGYLAWLHEPVSIRGRRWHTITGTARPMPEGVVSWLAHEAAQLFARGEVFIAPAELIGFNTKGLQVGLSVLAEIGGGTPVSTDIRIAQTLLELELPYIDNLSVEAIEKFRRDHDPELAVFRSALRKMIAHTQTSGAPQAEIIQELRTHIAELRLSAKYSSLQRDVLKLGGILATFSASVGALIQHSADVTILTLGFAGANAASIALIDLLKQAREAKRRLAENPCFVLWKLGVRNESDIQARRLAPVVTPSPPSANLIPDTEHWLCPPTNGFLIPGVRNRQ